MGKTSRFYRALVDKQLATSAYFYPDFSKDAGLAWTFAEAQVGVDPATLEKGLLEQIDRLQNETLTETELEKAINQTEAQFIFSLDSVSNQAAQIGYYETVYDYKYLDTYLDEIRSVTREQIREAAQKYLTENNRTVGYFQPISQEGGGTSSEGVGPALHHVRQPICFRSKEELKDE